MKEELRIEQTYMLAVHMKVVSIICFDKCYRIKLYYYY